MAQVKRSEAELQKAVFQQIKFLTEYCKLYDEGDHDYYIQIASSLRVWFQQQKNGKSVFNQIKETYNLETPILFPNFCTSETLEQTHNQIFSSLITNYKIAYTKENLNNCVEIVPLAPATFNYLPFDKWWGNTYVVKFNDIRLTRADIVCLVANKEGGAHLDPFLDYRIACLNRNLVSAPIFVFDGEIGKKEFHVDVSQFLSAAVRTIASESLLAINSILLIVNGK